MKRLMFRKLCLAMAIALTAGLLLFPLFLPTENYWRLVLQELPVGVFIGLLMLIPIHFISQHFSREIASELKNMKIDAKSSLIRYPEFRPIARQVTSFRAQLEAQRNELAGKQQQMRVMTDNMQEGLLLVSATGRVLSCNRAAFRLLQKEPQQGEFSVYDLSEREEFQRVVDNALAGVRGSDTFPVNDVVCQLIANPVVTDSSMTGAVLVLMDVTEREQRDALRREFTSNVSHELKTPLTTIYGIADMMASNMVKAADVPAFGVRIRDESARMIALIEDIIRLSRLDDDSFKEEVLPVDLFEIAENVLGQLQPYAEKKQIELRLMGQPAQMQGVPVIVEEMLYNLCDNAIKYNNEGGRVTMKVVCTETSAIFSVTDTGIGIPQADQERIFERFYRVDKSHSRQIGGTGLGLSIVKHGAAFHNATIELDSQLGNGTTMTLYFPRSAEVAAMARREAAQNPLDVAVPGVKHAAVQTADPEDALLETADKVLAGGVVRMEAEKEIHVDADVSDDVGMSGEAEMAVEVKVTDELDVAAETETADEMDVTEETEVADETETAAETEMAGETETGNADVADRPEIEAILNGAADAVAALTEAMEAVEVPMQDAAEKEIPAEKELPATKDVPAEDAIPAPEKPKRKRTKKQATTEETDAQPKKRTPRKKKQDTSKL